MTLVTGCWYWNTLYREMCKVEFTFVGNYFNVCVTNLNGAVYQTEPKWLIQPTSLLKELV